MAETENKDLQIALNRLCLKDALWIVKAKRFQIVGTCVPYQLYNGSIDDKTIEKIQDYLYCEVISIYYIDENAVSITVNNEKRMKEIDEHYKKLKEKYKTY